jgi:hypothetical protein
MARILALWRENTRLITYRLALAALLACFAFIGMNPRALRSCANASVIPTHHPNEFRFTVA